MWGFSHILGGTYHSVLVLVESPNPIGSGRCIVAIENGPLRLRLRTEIRCSEHARVAAVRYLKIQRVAVGYKR